MSKRHLTSLLAAAGIAALLAVAPVTSVAQSDAKGGKGKTASKENAADFQSAATPTGPAPKMPDGKPDLSGVWTPGLSFTQMGQVPLQPWAEEVYKQRRAT